MRMFWSLTCLMLLATTCRSQDATEGKAEPPAKKLNVKAEVKAKPTSKVVTSTFTVVTVDEDGNVISENIKGGEGQAINRGTSMNFQIKDGVLEILLPDGSKKQVQLGEANAKGKVALSILGEFPADELKLEASEVQLREGVEIKGLAEVVKGFEVQLGESMKGLDQVLQHLDKEESEQLRKKISEAIRKSLPNQQMKLFRLGEAAIVTAEAGNAEGSEPSEGAEVIEVRVEGEAGDKQSLRRIKVIRNGTGTMILRNEAEQPQVVSAENAILQKLDQIIERIEKLEADVKQLKQ